MAEEGKNLVGELAGVAPGRASGEFAGIAGGSALVGGLSSMATSNPYTLGVVMTHATYEHTDTSKDEDDMSHISGMAGITLQRLINGGASAKIDSKGLAARVRGDFSEDNFAKNMKNMRGEYAKNGVSSKEIGYQLTNQAFAEKRLNESQLVAAQKTLDMVFDDSGYALAQKINTGKSKGTEITNNRAAAKQPAPVTQKPKTSTKVQGEPVLVNGHFSYPGDYDYPKGQQSPTITHGPDITVATGSGGGPKPKPKTLAEPSPKPGGPKTPTTPQGPGTTGVYEKDASGSTRLVIGRNPDGSPIFAPKGQKAN